MQRFIELKHVGPKEQVRTLVEELARQLEKHIARLRQTPRRRGKRIARGLGIVGVVLLVAAGTVAAWAQDAGSLSPQAQELVAQLDAEDASVRQEAFLRLEALREPATADIIRRHLASRKQETRAFSVRALAAVEGAAAVPTLTERLTRERSWNVRLNIVLALEPLAGQDAAVMPALIGALRDRKAEVRMAAVDAVSRLDHPQAREAIRLRWRRERHRDVRRVLERAMARLSDGSAPPQGS